MTIKRANLVTPKQLDVTTQHIFNQIIEFFVDKGQYSKDMSSIVTDILTLRTIVFQKLGLTEEEYKDVFLKVRSNLNQLAEVAEARQKEKNKETSENPTPATQEASA